ncbi:MAG TPA: hypothetical protein VGZ22_09430 [Isosphaeraceae bacterium]|jgi:hypothetical protein|nr:hypothetical protein [Isosphaeraceae bacterium]
MSAIISSRTPEGTPHWCPVCGEGSLMEPSRPFQDAPCPTCGCLLSYNNASEGRTPIHHGDVAEVWTERMSRGMEPNPAALRTPGSRSAWQAAMRRLGLQGILRLARSRPDANASEWFRRLLRGVAMRRPRGGWLSRLADRLRSIPTRPRVRPRSEAEGPSGGLYDKWLDG